MGYFALLVHIQENFLHYLRMPISTGPTEVVEANIKPFINIGMNLEVCVTNFAWGFLLLNSFHLSCSTVFISAADVKYISSLKLLIARIHIC